MSDTSTPVAARVAEANTAPQGFLNPGGMARFKNLLAGNAAEFARWRQDPITRGLVAALQDAMVHPPAEMNPESALQQYGVTQGVALAFHLCVDPSVFWPGLFDQGGKSEPPPALDMDFETSLDAVFS